MATTVFSNGTVILPAWLEDVDALVYGDASPPSTPIRVFAGAPSGSLSIAATGRITLAAPTSGYALGIPTKTPATAADTGTAGNISWDASYVYVCTATNTWKRAAITTW